MGNNPQFEEHHYSISKQPTLALFHFAVSPKTRLFSSGKVLSVPALHWKGFTTIIYIKCWICPVSETLENHCWSVPIMLSLMDQWCDSTKELHKFNSMKLNFIIGFMSGEHSACQQWKLLQHSFWVRICKSVENQTADGSKWNCMAKVSYREVIVHSSGILLGYCSRVLPFLQFVISHIYLMLTDNESHKHLPIADTDQSSKQFFHVSCLTSDLWSLFCIQT